MRSFSSTIGSLMVTAMLALGSTPVTARAQTPPTSASFTEWDIFAATGGTSSATRNVTSVLLDMGGVAGSAGHVWVTAQNPLPRLGRLDPAATTDNYVEWQSVLTTDAGGAPLGLALNPANGDVWMTNQGDPSFILKLGGTNVFRRFRGEYPLLPDGVAVGADHAAIVALPETNLVGIGNAIARIPRDGTNGRVAIMLWNVGGEPRQVTLDNAGHAWFTERSANRVARLDLGSGELSEWALPSGSSPAGVHVRNGVACVVSEGTPGALSGVVQCLTVATNVISVYTRLPGDGFDFPQRPSFNADGEIFVTEQNGNAISFVSAVARATATTVVVMPAIRIVPVRTTSLQVADLTIAPTTYTVGKTDSTLTGIDDGRGYLRFALPIAALTYPFPLSGYPQPLAISAVFNDRGRGTGAVYVGEYFAGPLVGMRQAARIGRLELMPAATSTTLITNATSLRFDAVRGAAAPGTQAVAITEASGAALSWTAVKTASWLSLSPSSGATPASMGVSVVPGSLAAGTYVDSIVVDDGPGGAAARTIEVTLNVVDAPAIRLTPSSLTFAVVAGGSPPPAQWFTIENAGTGVLEWSAAANQSWVTLDRLSGFAPASVAVTVNPATLVAGNRTARVTVSSSSAPNSPQVLDIIVDVSSVGPQLAVAPGSLSVTAIKGAAAPAPQTLAVSNTGGGTIVWTASKDAGWLQISPATGTATPSATASIGVFVNHATLTRGTHSGAVTVSDPGASGSPRVVPVTLTVEAPEIAVSETTLAFVTPRGSSPAARTFVVTNTGDATLTFAPVITTSSGGSWLRVAPAGQHTLAAGASVTLTVDISSSSLAAGNYTGTVAISDPTAANGPVEVGVTLSVVNGPFVGLAPASLTFWALRARNPVAQTITISNTGNAALNFSATATSTGGWLAVAPASGTVAAGATTTLTALVSSSSLASGSYSGSITVSDPAAPNSPQSVSVSLTVAPAPTITLLPTTLTFTGARWTTCNGVESGQTVASQSLTVGNSGDATLNYTASAAGGTWLSVTPASGAVAVGATGLLSVSVDLRGLARGTYTGVVTASDPNATNVSQGADVTLTVGNAAATLCVTPMSMNFGTVGRNATTATQILQILNVGDDALAGWNATWTASRGTVNLSSSSGASPTSISVSVSSTAVRGDQTGTITITAAGSGSSPVTVNLTWNVQ